MNISCRVLRENCSGKNDLSRYDDYNKQLTRLISRNVLYNIGMVKQKKKNHDLHLIYV